MNNIENLMIYSVVSIIICILYNFIIRKISNRRNKINLKGELILLCLIIYLSFLFELNISPVYGFSIKVNWSNNLNLNPFKIIDVLKNRPLENIKNIIMFIPLGMILPLIDKKSLRLYKLLLTGGFISLLIETFQLFLYKKTDINHIIFAVIGTLIGFLIYKLINKISDIFLKNKRNMTTYYVDSFYLYGLICIIFTSVIMTGFVIKHKENQIEASNVYLINADNDYVIYDKDSNKKIAPASTTKMITALTVLDYCSVDEKVVVGDEINYIYSDASRAGLKKGNVLTVKQLLDGLLLPSGNDSAYVLAKYTGEKISGKKIQTKKAIAIFIKAINEKAKSIGATNSNFLRPDGYDEKGQYTTASDLACIAKYFMKNEVLSKIASKYKVDDVFVDGSKVTYENTNQLINPYSEYYYSNIKGLKTGSSSNAGKCLVSAADIDNKTYICVVMNSSDEGRWLDSLCLYQCIK